MMAAGISFVKRSLAGKIAVFVLSRVSKTPKMLVIPFRHCWDARSTASDDGTRYHEFPPTPSTTLLHGKTRTWSMGHTVEGTYGSKSCALVCFVLLALPFLLCWCSARMFLTLSHPTLSRTCALQVEIRHGDSIYKMTIDRRSPVKRLRELVSQRKALSIVGSSGGGGDGGGSSPSGTSDSNRSTAVVCPSTVRLVHRGQTLVSHCFGPWRSVHVERVGRREGGWR